MGCNYVIYTVYVIQYTKCVLHLKALKYTTLSCDDKTTNVLCQYSITYNCETIKSKEPYTHLLFTDPEHRSPCVFNTILSLILFWKDEKDLWVVSGSESKRVIGRSTQKTWSHDTPPCRIPLSHMQIETGLSLLQLHRWMVVSSAHLRMLLEPCVATQSCAYRAYRSGPSTQP